MSGSRWKPEDSLGDLVAHDLRRTSGDGEAGCEEEEVGHPRFVNVQRRALWTEHAHPEPCDPLAVLRCEQFADVPLGPRLRACECPFDLTQCEELHRRFLREQLTDFTLESQAAHAVACEQVEQLGCAPVESPNPAPIATRSLPNVLRATFQPPPTSPTMSSSGTNTSSKNTSLNAALPVISRRGQTSTPGAFISIAIMVIPACFGASGSVRTVAIPQSARRAPLVHTFWPLTSQPPSMRVPWVEMAAASDPAPGSLNNWHQGSSPVRLWRIHRSS